MSRYKLDIIAIQESRWNGSGSISDGETVFLYSGRPQNENHSEGVAFLITKKISKGLLEWFPINERIIVLKIKTRARKMVIINCYAPTEAQPNDVKEDFYEQLNSCITSHTRTGDVILIVGDFNAKIGSNNQGVEKYMGKHGLGTLLELLYLNCAVKRIWWLEEHSFLTKNYIK